VVFPRARKPSGETYELLAAINASPESVRAQVVPWSTGADIHRHFDRLLREKAVVAMPPPAPVSPNGLTNDKVLVVFDYDWSLINENSDTFIFKVLYPELLDEIKTRRATQPSWTQLMDDLLQQLATDKPHVTEEMIRQAVANVPVLSKMLDAMKLAGSQPNAVVAIVSDANTVYIESMLDHHGLATIVSEVITNPAAFETQGRRQSLRVRPYHDPQTPHGCALCPSNMCKGLILDRLRRETACTRVVYVGDGSGDFCPATRTTRCVLRPLGSVYSAHLTNSLLLLLAAAQLGHRVRSRRRRRRPVVWVAQEDPRQPRSRQGVRCALALGR